MSAEAAGVGPRLAGAAALDPSVERCLTGPFARAEQLIVEQRYREAITFCQQQLAASPRCVTLRLWLARALLSHGSGAAGVAQLEECLRIDPTSAAARAMLAQHGVEVPALAPVSLLEEEADSGDRRAARTAPGAGGISGALGGGCSSGEERAGAERRGAAGAEGHGAAGSEERAGVEEYGCAGGEEHAGVEGHGCAGSEERAGVEECGCAGSEERAGAAGRGCAGAAGRGCAGAGPTERGGAGAADRARTATAARACNGAEPCGCAVSERRAGVVAPAGHRGVPERCAGAVGPACACAASDHRRGTAASARRRPRAGATARGARFTGQSGSPAAATAAGVHQPLRRATAAVRVVAGRRALGAAALDSRRAVRSRYSASRSSGSCSPA